MKWLIDLLKGEIQICVVNLNELNCVLWSYIWLSAYFSTPYHHKKTTPHTANILHKKKKKQQLQLYPVLFSLKLRIFIAQTKTQDLKWKTLITEKQNYNNKCNYLYISLPIDYDKTWQDLIIARKRSHRCSSLFYQFKIKIPSNTKNTTTTIKN